MSQITIEADAQYGAIKQGFTLDLKSDYIVLVGENNAGKSSVLQFLFKTCVQKSNPQPLERVCLIMADRMYVDVNTQMGGRTLEQYNQDLFGQTGGTNKSYQSPANGPQTNEYSGPLCQDTKTD